MRIFVENCHTELRVCLSVLRWVGFLVPDQLTGIKKKLYPLYFFFWFMFICGIFVITQLGSLIQVWGNVSDMTNASFLLFTNLAFTVKVFNVLLRKTEIQAIIDDGEVVLRNETREEGKKIIHSANMETRVVIYFHVCLGVVTTCGWACSAERGQLPLQAWYFYDSSESPTYEIAFAHQSSAIVILALLGVCIDQLVNSLVSVCRARLRLVSLALETLTQHLDITDGVNDFTKMCTPDQEGVVSERLRECVKQHQAALESAAQIQNCFSEPMLVQFTVSSIIICATAYQLAVEESNNTVRTISMTTYLTCMTIQVFLYCYQGNHLTVESYDVARAAYECPWYLCSASLRSALLVLVVRSTKALKLTAGGITTLSLDSFMAILKASYSFFTVLQQIEQ